MEIVKMKLSELNPAEYNPRKALKPGDPAYEKLKASILSFGNVEPIVWNRSTGNVIGGHQRLRVLRDGERIPYVDLVKEVGARG